MSLASAFMVGPASAQVPETFLGRAAAKALEVQVLGQGTTLGVTTAEATSRLTAVAEGAGQLLNLGTIQKSEVAGSGTDVKPDKCALGLPVADILAVGLACGSSSATIVNGNPVATSEASVANLDLSGNVALQALSGATGAVESTVSGVLSTVCTAVAGTCSATTTVNDLVNSVLKTKTLDVTAGRSTSSVTTEASKVVSQATASGAEVKILPLPQVSGLPSTEPVATILVSSAKATAVYDRGTGTSTPSFDPSLVTIRLNTVLTGAPAIQEIKVPVNASQTILQGTPLESDIIVAAGRTVTNPDGTVGAIADGVRLHLLKGINGGVLLNLAHAEAGVAGALAQAAPALPAGLELPRTGGTPLIPLAGAGLLGLAVLARRVLVRAH